MFFKIDVLKNFADLIGKHQCWSITWTPATLLKRDSNKMFSYVKFAKFIRTLFLQNTLGDCFWTNPGDLCGSLCGEVMLSSFRISLSLLSNIMKPFYFLVILWTVNKSCYNDSLCLNECSKMIVLKRKRQLFGGGKLK